ncbi:MAG: hypothetical protein Fur0019_18830 [Tibeticola sp.]
MRYIIDLSDDVEVGIDAAREAANAERPPEMRYADNAAYVAAVLGAAAEGWCVQYAPRPSAPPAPSADASAVPQVVSAFQAKAALMQAGLYDVIHARLTAPDAPPLAKLAWGSAREFERASPTIAAIGAAFSITDQQLDALFVAASKIKA